MKILLLMLTLISARADDAKKTWPSEAFKHVVAYCYDFTKDSRRSSSITFPDGTLHNGVIRATTIRLTEPQVAKLRTLISTDTKTGLKTEEEEVDCYEPHHAFVFYDADWKPISSIEVCFFCDNYEARPAGVSKSIDLPTLQKFSTSIGLPMLEKSSDYSALYDQEHPAEKVAAPKKRKRVAPDNDPFANEDDPFAEDN